MPKDANVKDLEELHRQARTARSRLEGDWFLNLSFFNNQQWLAWDGRQLYRPTLRRNRLTLTDNRVTGCVRTEVAKMTKQRPVFVVTPKTADEEDANAARLGEAIMRYLWGHLNLQEIVMKALLWSRITGAGFLKCYWDDTIGDSAEVLLKADGGILTDGQGKPVRNGTPEAGAAMAAAESLQRSLRVKKVSQGDVRVEARSPFQMFVDPLADSFQEAEWVIEKSVKSAEYVWRRYGVELPADTPANPGLVEARMNAGTATSTSAYKGVEVMEYWCKPNRDHPNGTRVVWSKTRELERDDHPFDAFPYVMFSGIPMPGRLWPMSILDLLRGPQTELNKVRSQIAENRNRVGNPTTLASKQAVQDPEKFVESMTMPGGVVFFDDVGSPNAVPKFLEAPPLPDYVVEEIARIEESIAEISGQHEVTSAQVPPGVTAASAINLLQEADDTRLGPAVTDYETNLGRAGQKILELVAKFYTDARTIKLAGENGAWEIFDFRGSMMRDNTAVEVQTGSAFPQSKAARQAALQDLLTFFVQSGNPPHGRQLGQFLRDYDMGGAERLIADYTADESQVNRENTMLAQGQPQRINTFDDDQAHVDGHTDFQKSSRYSRLPPQIQQVFEQHVLQHRQRLDQQQQHQLEMQMQLQGQVPPNLTQSAFQDQQQLSQLQGHQQVSQQADQAAQQQQGVAQQQGFDQAAAEQKQRQQEEQHRSSHAAQEAQRMQQQRHADEQHQQRMQHAEQLHEAKLAQMRQQAKQQGADRGRPDTKRAA